MKEPKRRQTDRQRVRENVTNEIVLIAVAGRFIAGAVVTSSREDFTPQVMATDAIGKRGGQGGGGHGNGGRPGV